MASKLTIAVLGTPSVQFEQDAVVQPITKFRTAKARALFFYLAVTRQPQSRLALTGLFWPEVAEELALANLRVTLNNLHKLFPDYLAITRREVAFRTDQPHTLDLDTFAVATGHLTPVNTRPTLDERCANLALYRGEFLAGVDIELAPAFQEWLHAERIRWRQSALSALYQVATELTLAGRRPEAETLLHRLLVLEPCCEAAHLQCMMLLARSGNFTAGLTQYSKCRRQLAATFAVEPMPQTQALYERIQAAHTQPPHPLPAISGPFGAPFVGRCVELGQIHTRLANPACRLVTLIGLGGSGKTRLALEVARQIRAGQGQHFLNGVCFAPLQNVHSVGQLALAVAKAATLSLTHRLSPIDELCQQLRNREMLIILDNIEEALHADDAEECASLLTTLLSHCPHLKLLVTSRQPLDLSAEWLLAVDGLPCPLENDPSWQSAPAVAIFLHMMTHRQPALALTAEAAAQICRICRLVDGLPLAIQLAATRLPAMSLAQIALELGCGFDLLTTRQHELPVCQQNMRAIFEHSWQTLAKAEQTVLVGLAVFGGSFSEAAATAATGSTPWMLARLVERSLLRVETRGQAEPQFVLPRLAALYAQQQPIQRQVRLAPNMQ